MCIDVKTILTWRAYKIVIISNLSNSEDFWYVQCSKMTLKQITCISIPSLQRTAGVVIATDIICQSGQCNLSMQHNSHTDSVYHRLYCKIMLQSYEQYYYLGKEEMFLKLIFVNNKL